MSIHHDDRAMLVLEKAVYRAQNLLEKTQNFKPFLMILDDDGSIETVENEVADSTESYALLGEMLKECIKEGGVDVIVMVVDTLIPENFVQEA